MIDNTVYHDHAEHWLRGTVGDLILTDPPHLDIFNFDAEAHAEFVKHWRSAAEPCAPVLVHSCGPHPDELRNYLLHAAPDHLFVWQHPDRAADVHHFYLVYGATLGKRTFLRVEKPYPLYDDIIMTLSPEGGLVIDPFIGKGEVALAALSRGRKFVGCDNDLAQVRAARASIGTMYPETLAMPNKLY